MSGRKTFRERLTYANVMTALALFLAIGGVSYAATQLPKNAVGAKQLKKNAVTGAKIKKQTITAAKVKKGTLTGTQINLAALGTVPTAQLANTLAPAENWHAVVPENGWHNPPAGVPIDPAGYYKDQNGIVHLRGLLEDGTPGNFLFHLPAGYRPTSGKAIAVLAFCGSCSPSPLATPLFIAGSGPGLEGAVQAIAPAATSVGLDGITFRAES
jgi:hypothetical protein